MMQHIIFAFPVYFHTTCVRLILTIDRVSLNMI